MADRIEHRKVLANGISFHVAVSSPRAVKTAKSMARKKGPVFLCLHGFPEGWMSWLPLMRQLPEATIYAPDLRGYPGSDYPESGYDVFTLTNDIKMLMEELGLDRPILLTHDWGGALGWIFAHRYGHMIRRLAVVNCPHPKTLVRAVLQFDDFQTLRIPWVPPFQIPYLPEFCLTTVLGRKLLTLSFTWREGPDGNMDREIVGDIVKRFGKPADLRGAINYYRAFVRTLLLPRGRRRLREIYAAPIPVPVTLIWGLADGALSARVAQESDRDAGCPVEWRPLAGIGHFVDLEAPVQLAAEARRLIDEPLAGDLPETARRSVAAKSRTSGTSASLSVD